MNRNPVEADEQLAVLAKRLPANRTDARILAVAAERRERLRAWMAGQGLAGVLLSRRDNFAWLTGGGESHVLRGTEVGSGHLLVTPRQQYLIAYSMDAERLLDEQLPGQEYQPVVIRWYEGDPRAQALHLAGERLAADTPLPGAQLAAEEITRLHGPLAPFELDRCRWLARQTALNLEALAEWARPGLSEEAIGRQMAAAFAGQGIDLEVVIVGSDARLGRIWHATPSPKPVERYCSIHAAACRWGLHANVNRFVCFSPPPEAVRRAHAAAVTIQARVLASIQPELPYAAVLERQKAWYAELGYPEDWRRHFQGGPTGYFIGDDRSATDLRVEAGTAFDWFITVQGIQVEELSLLTGSGLEIASLGERWPRACIETAGGPVVVPDLWVR